MLDAVGDSEHSAAASVAAGGYLIVALEGQARRLFKAVVAPEAERELETGDAVGIKPASVDGAVVGYGENIIAHRVVCLDNIVHVVVAVGHYAVIVQARLVLTVGLPVNVGIGIRDGVVDILLVRILCKNRGKHPEAQRCGEEEREQTLEVVFFHGILLFLLRT